MNGNEEWNALERGEIQILPPGMKVMQPVTYREVLPVGAHVTIDDGIDARVTGVLIDQDGVQYKCVWWNGRERRCEWLMEFEVQAKSVGKMRVGFVPMSSDGADCA